MSDHIHMVPRPEEETDIAVLDRDLVIPQRPRGRLGTEEHSRVETIRLVQRLFISGGAHTPRVVVFSAAEAGSGCSSVCARVAETLADHLGGLVCLVDANCNSSAQHKRFEIDNDARVSDDEWSFAPIRRQIHPRHDANLWLLSYRPLSSDWQTPASLERFQSRLSELRKDFSYVLIDAPPLNAYADAMLLGKMADGLVIVIQANRTRREAVKKAKDILDIAGVRVLGAVLNKRTFPIPYSIYRRL